MTFLTSCGANSHFCVYCRGGSTSYYRSIWRSNRRGCRFSCIMQLLRSLFLLEIAARVAALGGGDGLRRAIDDEAAENMTFRMILLTDAMDRLADYDANVAELNDAMQPLKVLDALTVDQLKSQLMELKGDIEVVRNSLLK